jgi:hypothetical protein
VLGRAGSSITSAIAASHSLTRSAGLALLGAAHDAFLHGVRLALLSAAALAVLGAVFAAVAIPSRRRSGMVGAAAADPEGPPIDDPVRAERGVGSA